MIGKPKDLIVYLATRDDDKEYEVEEHKSKRSLDANAYYWVLVNKIAGALNQTKEYVHMEMLRFYSETYSVLLPAEQDITGLIKYYDVESTIKRGNKLFKSYKAYLPSSEMNTKQMSVLIDGVVHEAKQLGIETLTPSQIEELKLRWV
jgi:hypothetical protein